MCRSAARAEDGEWNARLLRHTQSSERVNWVWSSWPWIKPGWRWRPRIAGVADRQAELGRRVAAGQEQAKALAATQTILAHMAEQQARRDAIAVELRVIGERAAAVAVRERSHQGRRAGVEREGRDAPGRGYGDLSLCRQPLTSEHRDRMLADLAKEHDALADHYRANGGEGKALSERKAALDAEEALRA